MMVVWITPILLAINLPFAIWGAWYAHKNLQNARALSERYFKLEGRIRELEDACVSRGIL